MQFKYATLAVMATAAMATGLEAPDSTVYFTEEVTITSCAPTVTDCPAQSTVVSLTSYPVPSTTEAAEPIPTTTEAEETLTSYTTIVNTITSCHPTVTDCPIGQETTITVPCSTTEAPLPTETPVVPEVPTETEVPVPTTPAPTVPEPTVPAPPATVTITISSCPVDTPTWTSVPVGPTANPPVPTISGFPTPSNGTTVTPPVVTSPPIAGSASAVSGSIFAVGFAAMAAVFFA
ncbi:hypothetical protein V498_02336 [Pseudogymnoascus sp. VKM F-4517 (FW-2822)]|nr:hypothetical protein V498_02336 [Pseudogymnoascus sp. VKM F-4517 (FW-2822)]